MKLVLIWKHCHAGEQDSYIYASYALLADARHTGLARLLELGPCV